MPRDRPPPRQFEAEWLQRSLDRYYLAGLVFMAVLLAGFVVYKVREPALRAGALHQQQVTYVGLGSDLFSANCARCHGARAEAATRRHSTPRSSSAASLT